VFLFKGGIFVKVRRLMLFFATSLLMIFTFAVVVNANTVDPNNPGNTTNTAWAYNNNIDITQRFSTTQISHFYRLNVNVPDHTFQLTFNSSAGAQSTILVLNANGGELHRINVTGGEHISNVTLGNGTFFIVVDNNSLLSNANTYRLRMRPVTVGYLRAIGGQRVEVRSTGLYVDDVNRPLNYNVSWIETRPPPTKTVFIRTVANSPQNGSVNYHSQPLEVGRFTGPRGTVNNGVLVTVSNFTVERPHPNQPTLVTSRVNFVYNLGLMRWEDCANGTSIGYDPWVGHIRSWTPVDVNGQVASAPVSVARPPQNLSINFQNETLSTSSTAQMQFSTNGTTWNNLDSNLNISSAIPAAGNAARTLWVRYAGTNMVLASSPVTLTLPVRPSAPTSNVVRFDGFTESILVNNTMEFRRGTTGDWTQISQGQTNAPVTVGTANATYQVRVRGTVGQFPSLPLPVIVPARRVAPNAVYNAASDAITGVNNTMEFRRDGEATWTSVTGTTIPRNALGHLAVTVHVRLPATATAPVSNVRVINVPDNPAGLPTARNAQELQNLINLAPVNTPETIQISSDFFMPDNEIIISSGKNITLVSNNSTMRFLFKRTNNRQRHFIVDGNLTLGNNITICGTSINIIGGGGVYIRKGGTLTMNNGSVIQNCRAAFGGAVEMEDGSTTFNMNDGIIRNNRASCGGGVYNWGGLINMNGGTITGNQSTCSIGGSMCGGGGVWVARLVSSPSFNFIMTGGSITNNTAVHSGGGIHSMHNSARISIGNNAVITGNTPGNMNFSGITNFSNDMNISAFELDINNVDYYNIMMQHRQQVLLQELDRVSLDDDNILEDEFLGYCPALLYPFQE